MNAKGQSSEFVCVCLCMCVLVCVCVTSHVCLQEHSFSH